MFFQGAKVHNWTLQCALALRSWFGLSVHRCRVWYGQPSQGSAICQLAGEAGRREQYDWFFDRWVFIFGYRVLRCTFFVCSISGARYVVCGWYSSTRDCRKNQRSSARISGYGGQGVGLEFVWCRIRSFELRQNQRSCQISSPPSESPMPVARFQADCFEVQYPVLHLGCDYDFSRRSSSFPR